MGVVLPLINRLTLRDLKGLKDDKGVSEAVRSLARKMYLQRSHKVLNEGQLLRSARRRSLRLRAGDSRPVPAARARAASRPLPRPRQSRGRAEVPDAHRGSERADERRREASSTTPRCLARALRPADRPISRRSPRPIWPMVSKRTTMATIAAAYENFDMAAKHNPQDAQGLPLPRAGRRRAFPSHARQAVQAIETARAARADERRSI